MKYHSPRQQEKRNFLTNRPSPFSQKGINRFFRGISVAALFVFSVGIFGGTSLAAPISISVESLPTYTAGSGVSANQFNMLTGTIRGIYNLNNGNLHFFGINTKPLTGIGLNIGGSLQLGKVAGNPPCEPNLAGSLYFNTENKHFLYCNGANWRELDKKVGRKYTCTDEVGDGTGTGKWVGGSIECTPVDYNNGEPYDNDLASTTKRTLVCADETPDDLLCNVIGASSLPCHPKNLAYETRCYDADGNGKKDVWQYDDCGNKVGVGVLSTDPIATCTTGCTETTVSDKLCASEETHHYESPERHCNTDSDCSTVGYRKCTTIRRVEKLPDGSGLSPMHPQYTSGVPCAANELGCGTGADWADPYAADNYKHLGDSSFYDSPRNPNSKFAGICDESVACGSAGNIATAHKPDTGLCDVGTATAVTDSWGLWIEQEFSPTGSCNGQLNCEDVVTKCIDGSALSVWINYGSNDQNVCPAMGGTWTWQCKNTKNEATNCKAQHLDWIIEPWGNCASNGKQTRGVYCTDTPGMTTCKGGKGACYSFQDCLSAGAGDGKGYLHSMQKILGNTYTEGVYLDSNKDGIPDTSRNCTTSQCAPIDLRYETKCYNGDVWIYDDCGNKRGDSPVSTCGNSSCVDIYKGGFLPDGSRPAVHPMHPEYMSGSLGSQKGDGGFNTNELCYEWEDVYSDDVYTSPREKVACSLLNFTGYSPEFVRSAVNNYKINASCGVASAYICGLTTLGEWGKTGYDSFLNSDGCPYRNYSPDYNYTRNEAVCSEIVPNNSNCSSNIVNVDGICGPWHGDNSGLRLSTELCLAGRPTSVQVAPGAPGSSSTHYFWKCLGTGNGSHASCSYIRKLNTEL